MTWAVLLQLFKPQIVKFFLHAELLKLPFKVYYGLFDPLLTLITRPLSIFIFNFLRTIPTLSLILWLYPVDTLFKVHETVPQVLNHEILVFQFFLHDLKNLIVLNSCHFVQFGTANFWLSLELLDQGIVYLRGGGLHDYTSIEVAENIFFRNFLWFQGTWIHWRRLPFFRKGCLD